MPVPFIIWYDEKKNAAHQLRYKFNLKTFLNFNKALLPHCLFSIYTGYNHYLPIISATHFLSLSLYQRLFAVKLVRLKIVIIFFLAALPNWHTSGLHQQQKKQYHHHHSHRRRRRCRQIQIKSPHYFNMWFFSI